MESKVICKVCKKDHSEENSGSLTVCERKEYFSAGALGRKNGEKYRAFGIGSQRFQLRDIK
jgi:hypothetical protein